MMGFWMYQCDKGHSWEVYRDLDAVERPEDTCCSHGHEAVTLKKCPVARRLEIVMHSAARVVDTLKGQTLGEGRFYVSLRDETGEVSVTSCKPMELVVATELSGKLAQMSDDMAEKYLRRWELASV